MQKLIDRIGTQSHKFRLLFQFTRIQLQSSDSQSYSNCRIVLQRDSKKYSTNYIKLKPGKAIPINEPINIKATLFFDGKRQCYQSKEIQFEVMVMSKQDEAEVEIMRTILSVDRYLNSDRVVVLEDHQGSKIEVYITAEKVEGRNERDSEECSVEKSTEKRKYVRGYQIGEATKAPYNNSLVVNSFSRITEQPVEESKKSIIQLVKFDDEEEEKHSEHPVSLKISQTAIQNPQYQPVKKHKPIFSVDNQEHRLSSKSPSFRDIVNVNEKLPVKKTAALKKHHQEQSKVSEVMSCKTARNEDSQSGVRKQSVNCEVGVVGEHEATMPAFPALKKNLSEVEHQLAESMLRNSTVLQSLRIEQQEQLSKQRTNQSELKTLNARLQYRCEDLQRESQQVKERNQQLLSRLKRTQGELRDVKQVRDYLLNENTELRARAELMQRECSAVNGVKLELDSQFVALRGHLKAAQETIANQSSRLVELEAEKDLLVSKQSDLVQKYQKAFSDLSAERVANQELRKNFQLNEQNLQQIIRQKEQENSLLRNEVRHLEFMMVKPDDHLEDREKLMLKERLERLLLDLKEEAEENEAIQNLLRNDVKLKDREIESLTGLLERTQKQVQDDEQLWFGKERSLSKALEQKDRRITELGRELEKTQLRLQEVNKFVETQKVDLLGKMQILTGQLNRLKDVDQELAAMQLKHREADMKSRLAANQCTELKVEAARLQESHKKLTKEREESSHHIKDLQGQLVRTNVKLAQMVEKVFERDPTLAQILTQLKPID